MDTFHIALVIATLLCALVAGFVLAFATVIMPGLGTLDDRAFLRSFQVIDKVIQNGQPVFGLVWIGSALAVAASAWMSFSRVEGLDRGLILTAAVVYFVGVILPTTTVNIPLNNHLQTVDLEAADNAAVTQERRRFETRWNRWNVIRTVLASMTVVLLLAVVLRL